MRSKAVKLLCAALFLFAAISAQPHSSNRNNAAAISAATPTQSSSAKPIQHVLIVTIDGMKPESYTEPDAHGLKVPTLREMVLNGASSDGVQSVMPTVTYPSHTSMVTGANPGTHGTYTN